MNSKYIMQIIEQERLSCKLHKTTLCASAEISTTYYNELLQGAKNPSISVIIALLACFNLELVVAKVFR